MIKTKFLPLLMLCSLALPVCAQFVADDPDWKESSVPPAPSFDLKRLVRVDVSVRSSLDWGIDTDSIKITPDSVVRYVMVARSASGVVSAMYEGLRCNKGEVITYARHNSGSGWVPVSNPEWKTFREADRSNYARAAAKQGLCDGNAPAASALDAVSKLRNSPTSTR